MSEVAARTGARGVGAALEELAGEGLLVETTGGRYAEPSTLGILMGRLKVRTSGSACLLTGGERVEMDPRKLDGAIDGDVVHARTGLRGGSVLRVLERTRPGVSGVLRRAGDGWLLDPMDPSLPRGFSVEGPVEGLAQGMIAWGDMGPVGHRPTVRMRGVVSARPTPAAYVESVVRDLGMDPGYPADAVGEAVRAVGQGPGGGRVDYTAQPCVTIDPVDARDFDDAVFVEPAGEGWRLFVHIADVSAYVRPGGALDREAMARGTSVYLPDRVLPMLPEELSCDACSLRPGEPRPARSVVMEFDSSGRRTDFRLERSMIRSSARMTYEEVFEVMGGAPSVHSAGVAGMTALSRLLDAERTRRGALDLGGDEFRVEFGPDGWPEGFARVPDDESHRLVENFMVEANRAVAEHCGWLDLPALYRVHGAPGRESAARLARDLGALGVPVPRGGLHGGAALGRLLEGLRGSPVHPLAREAVLRSLSKAVYSASDSGHHGLALRSYLHFTSPIRRYPDLVVHRALDGWEPDPDGPGLDALAEMCSGAEQRAESAERDCVELMALLHLSRHPAGEFRGVVSGVEDYGVFVRLLDVPVDGLAPSRLQSRSIPVEGLRPGTPVRVEAYSVDPDLRQLTLRILEVGRVDARDL